jgi:hypothetical protein
MNQNSIIKYTINQGNIGFNRTINHTKVHQGTHSHIKIKEPIKSILENETKYIVDEEYLVKVITAEREDLYDLYSYYNIDFKTIEKNAKNKEIIQVLMKYRYII